MTVRIQQQPFDPCAELARFQEGRVDAGAVVCFLGNVRSGSDEPVKSMTIEHYPGMTESAIASHIEETRRRWQILDCQVIHRHGELYPGECIVMVAVIAKHRAEAFSAAEFLMDYLKSRAPFWKKEHTATGSCWVNSKDADEAALARWEPDRERSGAGQ